MSEPNDDQFEHDDLIDSLYQDTTGELPPAKIDNLILAKAKGQTVAASPRRKARWTVPLVAICLPALALGVVLKVGNFSFNDGSYEPTASGVYNTDDFVLHIPEQDAASQIKRVERPVFETAETIEDLRASQDMVTTEPDPYRNIYDATERAREQVAQDMSNEQQEILSQARSAAVEEEAYAVEIQKLEASTQPAATQAIASRSQPQYMNEADMADLPLAKTEPIDQAGAVVAESQKEEIIVTGTRRSADESSEVVAAMSSSPAPMAAPAPEADGYSARQMPAQALQSCPEIRPQACAKIYQPVCGQRDTGIRCVMAPCNEAVEWLNYDNQCMACADDKVMNTLPGECETLELPNQ